MMKGAVDFDAILEDHEKRAILSQIQSFGQTPSQLLTTPHPPRLGVEVTLVPCVCSFLIARRRNVRPCLLVKHLAMRSLR